MAKKLDRCPVCDNQHTYEKSWTHVQPPIKTKLLSTHLTSCAKFLALPAESKLAAVMGNAACLQCAAWDHAVHKFPGGKPGKEPKCSVVLDGGVCGGKHGKWYHEGGGSGGAHSVVATASTSGPGLYEVYLAPVHPPSDMAGGEATSGMIMIDPGSDTNFIRNEFAQQLGLAGDKCQFRLKVVDLEARPISTTRYTMEMEDKNGQRHTVVAMGLDTITVLPPDPDLSAIQDLVAEYPADVLRRPQGEVDILLGLKNSALHGNTVEQWGNLRILESPLGCGWSLRGTHPRLQHSSVHLAPSLSATAYMLQQADVDANVEMRVYHIQSQQEFQELDELGTAPPPVCLKCKGCRDCTFRRRKLTPDEQEVVSRVEQEMKVDSLTGVITAKYPWKKCVRRMVENRRQAQRVQETMEKHMCEVGTHRSYVEEMKKAIAEGKVRRLTQMEMEEWHGPTHYITTFAVVKPDSVSTRTRVVSNSAMRNARSKLSLNQCMWPGPNALSDLFDCLIFWRAVEVAMVTDLQKAYQAIHTGPMELHLRRFLFREQPRQAWEDFAFTRATFGDLSAGLILEVAKRRVAELGEQIDPVAAHQLKTYSYVDDSIMGGSQDDVDRMRGKREDTGYTGTVPQILAKGAMRVKFMAVSGSTDEWEEAQLAGKTLGVLYRLEKDEIYFLLKPGYYEGKAKSSDQAREALLLDLDQVEAIRSGGLKFTRRQALSMVMGTYDPLGLISPAILRGKLLLRRLYGAQVDAGWDTALPKEECELWANWFRDLLTPAEATFPRATKPKNAKGNPRLAGFGDASLSALCVVLYVVWSDQTGGNHARILTEDVEWPPCLGPLFRAGSSRRLWCSTAWPLQSWRLSPIGFRASLCFRTRSAPWGRYRSRDPVLNHTFGNRVLEVHRLREQLSAYTDDLAPVSHVPGEDNPADVGTRGLVGLADLGPGSTWQLGAGFLQNEFGSWPRTSPEEAYVVDPPPEECRSLFGATCETTGGDVDNPVTQLLNEACGETRLGSFVRKLLGRDVDA